MTLHFKAHIWNRRTKPLGLQIEPRGEFFRVEPNNRAELIVSGPDDRNRGHEAILEIEHEDYVLTVYEWPGGSISVHGAESSPWPSEPWR